VKSSSNTGIRGEPLSDAEQMSAPDDRARMAAKNLKYDMIPFPDKKLRYETCSASLYHSQRRPSKVTPVRTNFGYPGIMKIYFGFTVAGDRSTIDTARKVVQLLEGLGHEVLTRHLVDDNAWEADRSISPQEVFRRDMVWSSHEIRAGEEIFVE
jgi:hypothetical protein